MRKGKMKKMFALILAGMMLFGNFSATDFCGQVQAAEIVEEAFSASFVDQYASVGKALAPTITGASNATYQWYVDGVAVGTEATYIPTKNDLNKWIEVVVTQGAANVTAKLYCSKLPVVYIDTEGGQEITSKEKYIDATLRVQGNDQYSNSKNLYDGVTEIRGRGNSTWSQPKKPYRLKLDKKTDMFGMGKSKHWVLLANYLDESLLRNTLAYDMSGEMGMEHLSTVWVDVIMNGEYVGNYQFCENIRVDDTRVDIFDWESYAEDAAAVVAEAEGMDEDIAGDLETYMAETSMQWITSKTFTFNGKTYNLANYEDDILALTAEDYGYELNSVDELADLITGGYILELDEYYDEVSKFKTDSNQPIMFKNPEFVYTNTDMFGYVQDYVQAFEDAVKADDYTAVYDGASVHYSELYDFDALVDYWLVTEIFYNEEINKKSTYMYKDVDGLMIMGPIWDMDWSSGAGGTSAGATNQWATNRFNTNAQANQWYKDLVKDPYFLMKAQERYWEIRDLQVQDMLDVIDVHIDYLKESGQADYEAWLAKAGRSLSFATDSANLKTWMNTHVTWMDDQMQTEDTITSAFYTPSSSLNLALTDKNGAAVVGDVETLAPADGLVGTSDDVVLKITGSGVSGTAQIFVNGKIAGTVTLGSSGAQYTVGAALLTEEVDEKNVIEVKVKNNSGSVVARNYVTVKRTDCVHMLEGQWDSDTEYHWIECANGCGYTSAKEKHTFEWVIDREATKEANGIKHEECNVCSFKRNENTEFEYVDEPSSPSDDSKDIDVKYMVAISGNEHSQTGTEGPDDNVLDGNENTIWHTMYGVNPTGGSKLENRWIGVNLNEVSTVSGIRYLPRPGVSSNGKVTEYEVQYRATDDGEWITVASGTWNQSDVDWKYVGFPAVQAKQVRLVGVHTYAGSGMDRHMTCAEFRVTGTYSGDSGDSGDSGNTGDNDNKDYTYIPVSEMTATAGDYEPGDDPINAIDEDENTMWHTDWKYGPTHDDHWLQIELNDVYMVDGFHYLPRTNSKNGVITKYEIYTSLDGVEWNKVADGTWTSDVEWKAVPFDAVEAKYVKLVALEALSDSSGIKFASAAEVRVSGTISGGTVVPPQEELTVAFENGYAEVGTALSVAVTGAEDVTYSWTVDGKVVSTAAAYTPTEGDLESWIQVTVSKAGKSASAKMYCSKLPVVYIDTEGGQSITSKEKYIDADMRVQGNAEFNADNVLYDNVIEIRGRGNSTWSQPKKPYRLKLDKKTNMFGMGKSKHWVLLANYLDESLMRNTLAYDLSGSMDMEQMSTVWVDVVMNGEYVGNYQFCENIRVDDTRVDIFDWEGFAEDAAAVIAEAEGMDENTTDDLTTYMAEESMQWITSHTFKFNNKTYNLANYEAGLLTLLDEDYGYALEGIEELSSLITGGYLLELDSYYDEVSKFKTASGQPIMFKNPEFVNTNSDMMAYVQNYVQAFEDAVQESDYKVLYDGKEVHYSELYDLDALVDYWLISEVFYNEELNKKSTYMYKDVDGLMMMGPIWDMDWSSGAAGTSAGATNKWATNYFNVEAQRYQWYKYLVQDPYFLVRAQERYWEIRDEQLQSMLDSMDVHYEYLKESGQADYEVWLAKAGRKTTFNSDFTNLKTWLNTHVTWMDGQMQTEDTFDAAFLSKNSSLRLSLTDTDGTAFAADTAEKAPADAVGPNGEAVNLRISGLGGSAAVFVNGMLYEELTVKVTGTTVEINANALNAEVEAKNVIEVKVYNTSGSLAGTNYVTLKTYEAEEPDEPKVPVTEVFSDVTEGAWYVDSVQYVYDEGIIVGDGNVFAPDGATTRAMVAVILYRLAGSPIVSEDDYVEYNKFMDLPKEHVWYSDAVAWALKAGVSTGDDVNMMYNPNSPVTREQLALFLWRYAKYKKEDVSVNKTEKELFGETYVNSWAKEGFAWAVDRGIIRGSENIGSNGQIQYDLNPQGGAARAQLARMLHRYLGGSTD